MTIEVRLETLRVRRRKVDIRLKMAAECPLDRAAEIGECRQRSCIWEREIVAPVRNNS